MSPSAEFFALVDRQRGYCLMPAWVGQAEQFKRDRDAYGRKWRAECRWIAARKDGVLDQHRYQSARA